MRVVPPGGIVRLTVQIQFAGFVQWRQRMRSILVNLRLHRPKRCRLPLTYTWYWMVDTVGIEPTTAGLQGQLAPLVHACPLKELKWTDRDSNPAFCRAKAACSHYHYQPVVTRRRIELRFRD